MSEGQSRRLFEVAAVVAAPGLVVLGALAVGGWLQPVPALAGAAALALLVALVAWWHVRGLERLRLRIDHLAETGKDLPLDAPTVAELSFALDRLARCWQERLGELADEAATAERLLETIPDPLLVIDSSGKILRANRAAELIAETPLVGQPLAAGLRHPVLSSAVEAAVSSGQGQIVEISLPAPARRDYSALIEPLHQTERGGALIVLHDLTPIRLGERMRADFVANVSHELRTPLSSLLGFIETLRGPARDDEEARHRFLAIMHEQAERMTRLIEDLLSLSRIELDEHTRPKGTTDLRRVVAKVQDTLAMKARTKGMRIEIEAPGDLAPVPGDEDQLTQVFQNLLDNAIKYGRPETPVQITLRRTDTAVAVGVTDQGEGIAREDIPRLTERFYRVNTARSRTLGGTGLGLAIVKHILSRHRGKLSIDSRLGEGSTFTVELPAATDGESRGETPGD